MPHMQSGPMPYMVPLALARTPLHSRDVGSARLCAGLRVRRELHRDNIRAPLRSPVCFAVVIVVVPVAVVVVVVAVVVAGRSR